MTALVVAKMTIHDPERMREYARLSPAFVAKHGGVYLSRGGALTCLEDTECTDRVVVLKMPNTAAAKALFSDPEYREIAKIRQEASTMNMLIVQDCIEYTGEPELGV